LRPGFFAFAILLAKLSFVALVSFFSYIPLEIIVMYGADLILSYYFFEISVYGFCSIFYSSFFYSSIF